MTQPFDAWRAEIEAELINAELELADAREVHDPAVLAARDATIGRNATILAMNRIGAVSLAGALARRVHGIEAPNNVARSELTRAKHAVTNARTRIDDLKLALEQLWQIDPSPPVQESLEEMEVVQ
jgi:hypothetical protein